MYMVGVLSVLVLYISISNSVFVANLDLICLRCICKASTNCDETYKCSRGYCGPFYISKEYWEEADRVVIDDDPNRDGAFRDCAIDFKCAASAVKNYMSKHARDCNNDGVTDCDDFARIHFFGESRCHHDIHNTSFNDRYLTCRPPQSLEDLALL